MLHSVGRDSRIARSDRLKRHRREDIDLVGHAMLFVMNSVADGCGGAVSALLSLAAGHGRLSSGRPGSNHLIALVVCEEEFRRSFPHVKIVVYVIPQRNVLLVWKDAVIFARVEWWLQLQII